MMQIPDMLLEQRTDARLSPAAVITPLRQPAAHDAVCRAPLAARGFDAGVRHFR